jgi:predicted small secreted protein
MKLQTLFLCLIAALSFAACSNTFNGAGADIEKAGQKIQETF